MGIQGLLQFLKDASEPVHVNKYKGQTVAVDTYCWLHKGAFACAEKLAKGEPTDQYVAYCMKFVHMLLTNGVKPILVFDGCTLPSKKDVEKARREKRQANLQKGKQLLREGKLSEARDCFSRSINVTSAMAHDVIKAARAEGVDCIVAPYEADSQLAYLNKNGFAQAIITEDSDLLAFGCKKVILKMDKHGNGLEIDQARLGMCKQLGGVFTEEKFRYMCILSGCDYHPSIHGIGLGKACKLLKVANNPDIIKVIQKMGQYLKTNITIPDDYIEGFIRANNTFLYQLVFDPLKRKLVPLNPYVDDVRPEELTYAGPNMGDHIAFQISLGNIDINTMEKIDDYNPDDRQRSKQRSQTWNSKGSAQMLHSNSIWQKNYTSPTILPDEGKKTEEKSAPRGLILPSNKKTVKRPHDGDGTDADLLSQYSFSKNKKAKQEPEDNLTQLKDSSPTKTLQPLEDCSNNTEPSPRPKIRNNKFATFFQRRNEECGAVTATGTRSRFFCKPEDLSSSSLIEEGKQPAGCETINGIDNLLEINHKEDAIKEEQSVSPVSGDLGLKTVQVSPLPTPGGCFSWPGTLSSGGSRTVALPSSLLSLRKFQRVKPDLESDTVNVRTGLLNALTEDVDKQDGTEITSSPSETDKASIPENGDSSSEELDNSLESPSQKTSPAFPRKTIVTSKSKVPGLVKPKSSFSGQGKKIKPTGPAKVSGLSRGHAKAARNTENKPGLQATINDLWKNFSFKK
ncbi:exonuclease 1 [Spea bombifrons]|uniref:exonuclease 1 n=1 Tax=Spea bombifrons TaxID=233779 RepID=UPI00234AA314|nr:exonuclease 1 [Spea bombifrons]